MFTLNHLFQIRVSLNNTCITKIPASMLIYCQWKEEEAAVAVAAAPVVEEENREKNKATEGAVMATMDDYVAAEMLDEVHLLQ